MMLLFDEAGPHEREPVNWGLPRGFGTFINQLGVTAALAFSLGLISFLRHERLSLVAAIPCLFGGLFSLWFVCVILHDLGLFDAVKNSFVLSGGILMAINGVVFLAWLLPKTAARFARELEADDLGETNTRTKMKAVKLFGIATLIVGIVFILIHAFDLF